MSAQKPEFTIHMPYEFEKVKHGDQFVNVTVCLITGNKNIFIRHLETTDAEKTGLFWQDREYNAKNVLITPNDVKSKYVEYVDEASGETAHHDIAFECYFCGKYVLDSAGGMYNHMHYLCECYPFKCAKCSAGLFAVYDYKCKICNHQNEKMSIKLDADKKIIPDHCDFMIFIDHELHMEQYM